MPTATFRLTLDGQDLTPRFRPRLSTLSLTEQRGDEADQLDLVLTDQDGQLAIPRKGAVILLELGWLGAALTPKGQFRVDEVEASGSPDLISLKARSADFTADFRRRRGGSWRSSTLGAVLQEIASRQGLTAKIDAALAATPLQVLDQSQESDAALLRRLGREHDAVATVKAGALIFTPIGASRTSSGLALPEFVITRKSGDQHRWRRAERDSYSGVEATWHDTDGAERRTVVAGDGANAKRLRRTYASEASAARAAKAELGRVARGEATMSYSLALGRPDLYPELTGRVQGFKPEIDAARWVIERCVHTLSGDGGLTTSLELETA